MSADSSIVKDFDREMIRDFLEDRGLKYLTDSDGDYWVLFGDIDAQVIFVAAGPNKDVYSISARLEHEYSTMHVHKAIAACNEWNRDKRWPKAYVSISDKGEGLITLEASIDLEKGIHQALLNDFSNVILFSIGQFAEWIRDQKID